MSTIFLNWRGPQGRETIDQLDSTEFATRSEFRDEQSRLISEYALAGMSGAYWSTRPCANWEK
jgi:hypothetical protein